MIYDFDQALNRRATESLKWRVFDEDVLPMWVADMDFVSPEPVIRALQERVAHGVFGYALTNPALRQTLVERMAQRYHWSIQPEHLVFISGVVTGFNRACHALAAPDGAVLIQTPVYSPILHAAEVTGVQSQAAPLTRLADGRYGVDWEAVEAAITPQTRLFLLCNPHNPVGRVFRRDELERCAEICLRHGVKICSDEIHGDLIFSDHQHLPIATLSPEVAQNTITLIAPSKTYNIAGLHCAAAIIPDQALRQRFLAADKGLAGGMNLLGQTAALAAYQHGQEWLEQVLGYLEANCNLLDDFVRRELPGVRMAAPEGTYLGWLDCREAGIAGNPDEFFLKQARVALSSGAGFGPGGEGFVRLNFGCRRAMLVEALERMKQALQSYPPA